MSDSTFPWHPHRGIETIKYVLKGSVEHNDSLGNTGTLAAGDVQWMTAGSGIMHREMPNGNNASRSDFEPNSDEIDRRRPGLKPIFSRDCNPDWVVPVCAKRNRLGNFQNTR